MDVWTLVTGEADEPNLSISLGSVERRDHAALCEVAVRVVFIHALVDLPEIEIVGPEPLQRFVQLPHRHPGVSSVSADLGHQEHTVATIRNCAPHPDLAFVLVVL